MITLPFLLEHFQLFCFDFDGLLVDTEMLHYRAYKEMFKRHGCTLELDFTGYTAYAHHASGNALERYAYAQFPALNPVWQELRSEKSLIYSRYLREEAVPLMPGVKELITALREAGKELTVVTNSYRPDVEMIITHQPLLKEIPRWITREEYLIPKPDPAGYLYALAQYPHIASSSAVGFEDTLKGAVALQKAGIYPILICDPAHPQREHAGEITCLASILDIISGSCV